MADSQHTNAYYTGSVIKATQLAMTNQQLSNILHSIGYNLAANLHSEIDRPPIAASPDLTDNFIAPLSYYGFLQVSGPDSAKFLQGQTTCHVDEIDDSHSGLGAYCTAKGKMLSSFRIASPQAQTLLLRMRRGLITETLTTLNKYIVFSKAEQIDTSDTLLAIGLHGPLAAQAVLSCFGKRPAGINQSCEQAGNLALQIDEAGHSFECWIQQQQLAELWPQLSAKLTPRGSPDWELLTIRAGIGEVTEQTHGLFFPHMLNYQLINAVSFTKGCYTGQEVVARMEYKGKLKRHMYRVRIDATGLEPGTPLFARTGETVSQQSIGEIVNIVSLDKQTSEALAVITVKDVQGNTVVAGNNAAAVEVLSLPYAITNP